MATVVEQIRVSYRPFQSLRIVNFRQVCEAFWQVGEGQIQIGQEASSGAGRLHDKGPSENFDCRLL